MSWLNFLPTGTPGKLGAMLSNSDPPRKNLSLPADLMVHIGWFCVNVGFMYWSESEPHVLIYAIFMTLFGKYVVLGAILRIYSKADHRVRRLLRRMVRHPNEGGAYTSEGAQTPIGGHLVFLGMIFVIALFVSHLGKDAHFHLDWGETVANLTLALQFFVLFEFRVIAFRGLIVDFEASELENAGYNFGQSLGLALATMLATGVLAAMSVATVFPASWAMAIFVLLAMEFIDFASKHAPVYTRRGDEPQAK